MTTDLKKVHALIADSDRNLRSIIRGLLNAFGLPLENIRQCDNGEAALELLDIRKSDFLITGWKMTPMDGLTLVRTLRNPNATPAPGIPVIFCSRFLDQRLLQDVRSAGVNEVIVKPINAGAIKSRVTAVLERPRPVITLTNYIGPDRRRGANRWNGVDRRSDERDFFID